MRKSGSKHNQTYHAGGACGSIRIAGDGSDPYETEDVIQESIHFPIGIGEHAGSGVPDIFDIWKNEGLKEPQVKEQFGAGLPDRTTMILPLMEAEADISEKSQAKSQIKKADQMERRAGSVLNVLRTEPTATTPKIAIMLGITERQVRTVLDQMKDQQILRFERHGRSGRWIINDSKTE